MENKASPFNRQPTHFYMKVLTLPLPLPLPHILLFCRSEVEAGDKLL